MNTPGPWAAVLFTVLTCAAPAWAASGGPGHATDSELIATRLTELGDTVYGPEAAATVAHLDMQSKFLDDALRLLDADHALIETDPELLRWRNSTEAELRTQLGNPALIKKNHAIAFARLTKDSSLYIRGSAVNEFRSDVNTFSLQVHLQVDQAARSVPLESVDTEVQAIRREVDVVLQLASGSDDEARRRLEMLTHKYLDHYGNRFRGCWPSETSKRVAEREQMRDELRTMGESWRREGQESKVGSSALDAINRLRNNMLSPDKEGWVKARQAVICGRYDVNYKWFRFSNAGQWLMPLLSLPIDYHPL